MQVFICLARRHPPPGSAIQKSVLDQIRLIYFLDRACIIPDCGCQGIQADGPPVKFPDDREKQPAVCLIKTEAVHLQQIQCHLCHLPGDLSVVLYHGKIAHPL